MNVFARFDENPAMTLQDIKETKRYGRTNAHTDNVKTVYPNTNKVCGGYNNISFGCVKETSPGDRQVSFKRPKFMFDNIFFFFFFLGGGGGGGGGYIFLSFLIHN